MKVKDLIELLSKFDGDKELMSEQEGYYISDLQFLKVEEDNEGVVWLKD
jgi:hypothetical protein